MLERDAEDEQREAEEEALQAAAAAQPVMRGTRHFAPPETEVRVTSAPARATTASLSKA